MNSRTLAALMALIIASCVLPPGPLGAQVNVQLSGTVVSIEGPTMVLRTNAPPTPRVTLGVTPSPAAAPPPTLVVDLEGVPASQWVFLREGERIAVVGLPSEDGRRFTAIRVIGGAGPPRQPQAP